MFRDAREMAVPYIACMALVAQIYNLPPRVLPAIQAVEGGRPGTVSRNTNGSEDFGIMQINTLWLPYLAQYTRLTQAEVRNRLIHRTCFNIAAAGLVFRIYLDEAQGDLMRAVGNYHSHTPVRHQAYQAKVIRSAARMFGQAAK